MAFAYNSLYFKIVHQNNHLYLYFELIWISLVLRFLQTRECLSLDFYTDSPDLHQSHIYFQKLSITTFHSSLSENIYDIISNLSMQFPVVQFAVDLNYI